VIGDDSVLQSVYESGVKYAHITVGSIGDYSVRKKLVALAESIGFELVTIIDPSSQVSRFATLGKMVYVGKNAVINSNTCIGNYCIINTGAIVEHGTSLRDFVHIAPGSVLVGDITVFEGAHIGLNSSILQGLSIGKNAMIGAGSVVLRNVCDNETVYGVVKKE
jgi:sugar O-acyltransferase (sialic acid O-acetyltransferase NeuD family)